MDNCIYQEEKLNKYSIEEYFNQLKGNRILGQEERIISNSVLHRLKETCKISSVSKVFKPSEFSLDNGVLILGEEKIHSKLFEQNNFHDIMSVLVFIITIIEKNDKVINDKETEENLDLLDQYYETSWKYAALQGYRDHIIDEYKVKEMQSGKGRFTPILGPGYFAIDLEDSEKLYRLLNAKKLGITLNDKNQFTPVSTICGFVIGTGFMSESCKMMFDNPCKYCLAVKKSCGYCSYSK